MNIVLYAGDRKYHSVLEPIARELKNRHPNKTFRPIHHTASHLNYQKFHNFLYYYTNSTQLQFPQNNQHFEYDGQVVDEEDIHISQTLNLKIPFKPNVLIIARERWQPEQSIIHEFKTKWNCKICCVEVSSHLINNIENRLEMLSRNNHPQNMVDYFFEHSEWARQRRIDCLDKNFGKKSIVVGNTRTFKIKYDKEKIFNKYKIDPNKKQILFWGVINTTRNIAFDALKKLREKAGDEYQIFYKCYPGEPHNPKFQSQFNPFIVEGVTVIYDENDIYPLSEICDTHIAATSSVFNFAFVHNKKIINLDNICKASYKMNDINTFLKETNNGVEDSAKFWMNVWKLNTIEEFKNFIDLKRVNKFKETNKIFEKSLNNWITNFDWECSFLDKQVLGYGGIIGNYFDQFNLDGKAPSRIINFLEDEIK